MNTLIEAHNSKTQRLSSISSSRRSVELDFFTEASNNYRSYIMGNVAYNPNENLSLTEIIKKDFIEEAQDPKTGIIAKQTEFTIARFEKQLAQMQGNTKTAILKSGVTLEGSGLNILRYNTEQAEIEKDTLDYNSKVAEYQKIEQANFARMQGTIARQEGRIAALGYYAQAGTSLLKGFG